MTQSNYEPQKRTLPLQKRSGKKVRSNMHNITYDLL